MTEINENLWEELVGMQKGIRIVRKEKKDVVGNPIIMSIISPFLNLHVQIVTKFCSFLPPKYFLIVSNLCIFTVYIFLRPLSSPSKLTSHICSVPVCSPTGQWFLQNRYLMVLPMIRLFYVVALRLEQTQTCHKRSCMVCLYYCYNIMPHLPTGWTSIILASRFTMHPPAALLHLLGKCLCFLQLLTSYLIFNSETATYTRKRSCLPLHKHSTLLHLSPVFKMLIWGYILMNSPILWLL